MEYFDLVDSRNRVIGKAARQECHGNPSNIHRAVHVLVLNERGEVLIQKRSVKKDVQPGKWDTSVGGHVNAGESYEEAAHRETREELGFGLSEPVLMYEYLLSNEIESEWIRSYCTIYEGPFNPCPVEIDEIQFKSISSIDKESPELYTPNFIEELKFFKNWIRESSRVFSAGMNSIK